jgi:hypothetical protein
MTQKVEFAFGLAFIQLINVVSGDGQIIDARKEREREERERQREESERERKRRERERGERKRERRGS